MENHHVSRINPLSMAIFNSYALTNDTRSGVAIQSAKPSKDTEEAKPEATEEARVSSDGWLDVEHPTDG